MSLRAVAGKSKIVLLVLLAALVFSGCVGVTKTTPTGKTELKGYVELLDQNNWQPIAIASILISFFIVSLAYMLAEFIRSPELNAWAKNELYEVLISVFLLASVFFFVGLGDQIAGYFTMGADHIEWGMAYLENVKVILELEMYPILIAIDLVISTLATWNFSYPVEISAIAIIVGTSPMSGLNMLASSMVFIIDGVGMFIAVVVAQMEFLHFSEKFALGLFLPLGILLRTFPLSRRLGSTLIALAITMYFVYPLTLALNQEVFDAAYIPLSNAWYDSPLETPGDLAGKLRVTGMQDITDATGTGGEGDIEGNAFEEGFVVGDVGEQGGNYWQRLLHLGGIIGITAKPVEVGKFFFPDLLLPGIGAIKMFHSLVFTVVGPWMMQTAVLIIVLPVIDIIISITFFRSLSLAIGGEPEIMGLTRIV